MTQSQQNIESKYRHLGLLCYADRAVCVAVDRCNHFEHGGMAPVGEGNVERIPTYSHLATLWKNIAPPVTTLPQIVWILCAVEVHDHACVVAGSADAVGYQWCHDILDDDFKIGGCGRQSGIPDTCCRCDC